MEQGAVIRICLGLPIDDKLPTIIVTQENWIDEQTRSRPRNWNWIFTYDFRESMGFEIAPAGFSLLESENIRHELDALLKT